MNDSVPYHWYRSGTKWCPVESNVEYHGGTQKYRNQSHQQIDIGFFYRGKTQVPRV